ncbi:hypothetical protein K2173_018980 [Erythroxylum novogranatense]|uniref:Pentatricopeptide repeat-containing protein n=1 Tax=Erythroxylum novogranatense TaxID=1862640 RepID=A0AAV8SSA2_9ROSI|nr:hypothetical protein K2173_018980 [Erythroxylum novogranatense]
MILGWGIVTPTLKNTFRKPTISYYSTILFQNDPIKHKHRNSLVELLFGVSQFGYSKLKNPSSCNLLLPRISALLCLHFSSFPRMLQSLDEMPQRAEYCPKNNINVLLELLTYSDSRPYIVAVMIAHSLAIKIGTFSHLPIATSLLSYYSRAGNLGSSLALFDETCKKDTIFWNAMLTACIDNHCFQRGLDFFVYLMEEQSGFDSTSLLHVVSALSHLNNLQKGQIIHGFSFKTAMLFLDNKLYNGFIDMYAKLRDLSSSELLFVEMEHRDIVSWNSVMTGCLHNDYPEKTLWYLRELTHSGERVDHTSLSSAIAAATSLSDIGCGEAIHGLAVKVSCENGLQISVSNSLISLYSQFGDVAAAEIVFGSMQYQDVVTWNAIISGFASNGMVLEAFDSLYEMHLFESPKPDSVTMVCIIPLCSELMLLKEGKSVHGYVIRHLLSLDLSVTNSLIDMYMKCNSVGKAELLFSTVPTSDLVSWNTMISGYSKNGHNKEAKILFKELLSSCLHLNLSTLFAILSSCSSHEGLKFGKSIHSWQLKLGFSSNILAVNSLMHMYACCGDLVSAFSLLQMIISTADVACWNTIIVGCTNIFQFQKALETFNLMRRNGSIKPDTVTFVNVISACGNLLLVSEGKAIHALTLKTSDGLDTSVQNALITMYGRYHDVESAKLVFNFCTNRNLCSWNCLISALSQNKNGRETLEQFLHLELKPNEITIVGILSACTQLGILRFGRQIHGYTVRNGFQYNSFISAAFVEMYSSCGRLDIAIKVFRSSPEKATAAWNSMIAAYGYHSNGRKAINLFQEMLKSGIRPTKSTFVSLLSACSHSGLVEEGMCYVDSMLEEYGVEPVTDHHVYIVDMLGRSGKLQKAFSYIKQLQTSPEPGVWGALLSACNYHGDIEMGREVAELLFELDPQNVGYYICLSNMYVFSGRWKEAVELRNVIEDKELKKPTGFSLIDVGIG